MESTAVYSAMMRIRPAQACAVLKRIFFVRRRSIRTTLELSFYVDPVSIFGIELLREGVFEPELTQLFRRILRSGDTCVDLGGNEGYFSVVAATLVGSKGFVHCIEPQSRLQSIL